jgi:ribonuclease III
MSINLLKFENKLKIKVKNKSLFIEALTHKSANKITNNEKLEFLGDRVIGLVITKKLFDLYPNDVEGNLDKKLSNLVNKKTCALISWNIGLNNFIILGDKRKRITLHDEKILSDAIESLIGAIYIDSGFNYVERYLLEIWKKEIEKTSMPILDSKTILQEHSLKLFKKLPIYKLISMTGSNHKPTYKISVSISGSKNYTGTGRSKQLAEQSSAENLLKNLNK